MCSPKVKENGKPVCTQLRKTFNICLLVCIKCNSLQTCRHTINSVKTFYNKIRALIIAQYRSKGKSIQCTKLMYSITCVPLLLAKCKLHSCENCQKNHAHLTLIVFLDCFTTCLIVQRDKDLLLYPLDCNLFDSLLKIHS